jgi:hypothetical protein
MLVFSLHNSILLWSFNTGQLVNGSIRRKKIMHLEFRTIIRMQTLNFEIKLCLYKAKKRFNKGTSLRLAFHEMHPSKPGIIIHNRERKKTEPFIDGVAIGPQISQWTISKGIQV